MMRQRIRGSSLVGLFVVLALLAGACGADDETQTGGGGDGTEPVAGDAGGTEGGDGSDRLWMMVTDQAGLGDQGFNDLAWEGTTTAAERFGGETRVIESSEQAQYVPNLQQALDLGASMTTGVGFLIADAMSEVAGANPDGRFVLIDAVATDADEQPLDNVRSVLFKEHEAAYLAGIIAGMTTEADRLGFVGGLEIPPVVRFLVGFQAALQTVNPEARIDIAYVGDFQDPAKTKETTNAFFDSGADVVFEVAGGGGLGAYEAATERGPDHWVLGTDTCKDHLAPDNFLTSANKDVAGAIVDSAEAIANDAWVGGIVELGLAEGRVGVCEETFGDLPQDIQEAVRRAEELIKSGEIVVPASPEA